ncbi:hypothetical protein ONS96_011470 [Cadophora gregata f. sp. sojae]|nr:hypothetical protein ONS96_011470 [Cadophora gregata f. sp. sojae]
MESFEVVLANGTIVRANEASYPELFKALRGGGANFGIVTELALSVHSYHGMWGGGINYDWQHGDALIDAFLAYGEDNVNNVDASVILGLINYEGQWVWHADIEHLDASEPPPH